MNADSIKIECEEDSFWLVIETADEDDFHFRIHGCAEELHEQVTRIIGSWLAEGRAAARMPASAVFACNPDESGGYAADDPKHPQYHSVHADLWDARAGK